MVHNRNLTLQFVLAFFLISLNAIYSQSNAAQITAAIGKVAYNSFGQGIPDSFFSCANGNGDCISTTTSAAETFVSDIFGSAGSNQQSFAFARGSYSPTTERGFSHPHTGIALSNRGALGFFGTVGAETTIRDEVVIKPFATDTWTFESIRLQRVVITLYDHGNMYSPPKPVFYAGGHNIKYEREFDLSSVNALGSNTTLGFLFESAGEERYSRSVSGGESASVDRASKLFYAFTNFPHVVSRDVPGLQGLLLDFLYRAELTLNYDPFLMDTTTTATAEFQNTSGIDGIELFDDQGNDVTRFFEFTNSLGAPLFTPEPSSLLLLAVGAISLLGRRKRS